MNRLIATFALALSTVVLSAGVAHADIPVEPPPREANDFALIAVIAVAGVLLVGVGIVVALRLSKTDAPAG